MMKANMAMREMSRALQLLRSCCAGLVYQKIPRLKRSTATGMMMMPMEAFLRSSRLRVTWEPMRRTSRSQTQLCHLHQSSGVPAARMSRQVTESAAAPRSLKV